MKNQLLYSISNSDIWGKKILRAGMIIVFLWIGLLKFFNYEAESIVPFVANSPFMSFFYHHPKDYAGHVNKEGEFIAVNHKWQAENNTYRFAAGLGIFLITLAILLSLHQIAPLASMVGSILIFLLTLGTLSFLVTTPESWVSVTKYQWDFPFLSARGRLVIKDVVILGGSIITMSESASLYLSRKTHRKLSIKSKLKY